MNKGCCFTGHRNIDISDSDKINSELKKEIEKIIDEGICDFYNGGAYGFDLMSAKIISELKNKYNNIKLHLIIPYAKQSKSWSEKDKEVYERVKSEADSIEILSEHYFRGCMQIRNRMLVDKSDVCICYIRKKTGGTAYTLNYAKEKGLKIIYL